MKPWLLFLTIATAHGQIARWADVGIPVRDGLELWLDASRENEAREAHYMNRLGRGQGMEIWHDSSGHARNLVQWSGGARPAFRDGMAVFDGDDFLATLLDGTVESKGFTAFIVAAPDKITGDFPAMLSAARRGGPHERAEHRLRPQAGNGWIGRLPECRGRGTAGGNEPAGASVRATAGTFAHGDEW